MNKRILITGGNGFIGANLVHALVKRGITPYIMLKTASDTWRISSILDKVHAHCADLRDSSSLTEVIKKIKPQVIFHTAIYGGYVSQSDERNIFETNFFGTINLLKACSTIDYELFINTGSSSEYGIKDSEMKENDMLEPLSDYGVSKAAASIYCRAVALREKRPIITLRLFSPFGYYEEPERLIPSVIASCLKGVNPKVSSPDSVRDFIFVGDVVEAYMKAMKKKNITPGEIFNVARGQQCRIEEVVKKIIMFCGEDVHPEWKTMPNPRVEPSMWQADIAKTKKMLGWNPATSVMDGLERTIQWFQRNMEHYNAIG